MLDIKVLDRTLHYKLFEVSNDLIMTNAKLMVESGKTVIARTPIVPGYTDSLENLQGIIDFASSIGIGEINLLPYHRFGESKYKRLGREYQLAGQATPRMKTATIC